MPPVKTDMVFEPEPAIFREATTHSTSEEAVSERLALLFSE
jgi:hypothetical protein